MCGLVMKTILRISLLLNLALFAGLIFLWSDERKTTSESFATIQDTVRPTAATVPTTMTETAPPQNSAQPPQKPFRWEQLYAEDYCAYVKNLREIGCPEPALRAIVTADVDASYRQRSGELEKKLDDLNNGSWAVQLSSYQDQQELKLELQNLPAEESAEINNFLGLKPAAVETSQPVVSTDQPLSAGPSRGGNLPSGNQIGTHGTAKNEQANSDGGQGSTAAKVNAAGQTTAYFQPLVAGQLPPPPKSASLPLVFQPVDSAALNLNAAQQQAVNDLRQQFINTITSASQNPSDPAYQQVWQQAQSQSDSMLEIYMGYNAYIKYWYGQYQKSLAN